MQQPENIFSPMSIDRQIEKPATLLPRGEARLVHDLQDMYEQAAINRVWERLASQRQPHRFPQQEQVFKNLVLLKEGDTYPPQRVVAPRWANAFTRRLSLLTAVLAVVLLAGSLALSIDIIARIVRWRDYARRHLAGLRGLSVGGFARRGRTDRSPS